MNKIVLKIYMKDKFKSFKTILSSEKQLNDFMDILNNKSLDYIRFGNMIFKREDIKYCEFTQYF